MAARDNYRQQWEAAHQSASSGDEDPSTEESDTDDWDELNATMVDLKQTRTCKPCFSAKCFCHCCYVIQFLLYMILFPLWAKWLVTSPQPVQYWHSHFPEFPRVNDANDGTKLALKPDVIQMSSIPDEPSSCNYSCAAWRGYRTSEMNFQVRLKLDDAALAPAYVHTVYPVLLASADFKDWWVVADRRNAQPQPFFGARTMQGGLGYEYVTDKCTSPPQTNSVLRATSKGSYVMACVIWNTLAFEQVQTALKLGKLTDKDVRDHCSAVGGVCGYSCGSSLPPTRLTGCDARGRIEVTPTSHAGRTPVSTQPEYKGKVSMKECKPGTVKGNQKCNTRTVSFSDWKCHRCRYKPPEADERRLQGIAGIGGMPDALKEDDDDDDAPASTASTPLAPGIVPVPNPAAVGAKLEGTEDYESLPPFEVTVSGTSAPAGGSVFGTPRTIVLVAEETTAGATLQWKRLYKEGTADSPLPFPVAEAALQAAKSDEDVPVELPSSKTEMAPTQLNSLDIEPSWCFGNQGPLYIVACAVNSTIYTDHFKRFKGGQMVAPPPFNDRCIAVSGTCGHACQSDQSPMPHCLADGTINHTMLVAESIEPGRNRTTPVWLFIYCLLIGFAVKTVTLCPGIFSSYPHCRRYNPELTESLRYIVVCIPSAGEAKSTVLRNVVGAIGCMPKGCRTRYHVVQLDEGHRHEQKVCWKKLCDLIAVIPGNDGKFGDYEENVLQFFHMWVDETNKMDLGKLRDGSKADMEPDILARISGRTSLAKLKKESGWSAWDPAALAPLEAAIAVLEDELKDKKSQKFNLHRDDVADWEPRNKHILKLRMHYLARSKPQEDERTIKAQHVAPGTWYYKVPPDAENSQWLALRANATEMVYGQETDELTTLNVPVRTSRGKAGGLNFTENYLSIYADRPDNLYQTEQDEQPYLFSICDARHQFQQDFFHTTIPYFFDENEELNESVAFTQCPQYFHEMQDKLDYLDNNNAQFFRLNCMIRNCCGGVSSCGTNGTWMIKHKEGSLVWETDKRRVRDTSTKRKKAQLVERRIFHESCKVEDTASSLQQVLRGRRSQFINRRLSYGMAKNPTDYLAAVQRWAEGGVVLSMQTLLGCHKGVYMVWCTLIFFFAFIFSLFHLMHKTDYELLIVQWGMMPQSVVDTVQDPMVNMLQSIADATKSEYYAHHPKLLKEYVSMTMQFIIWVASLAAVVFLLYLVTEFLGFLTRRCGVKLCCIWPNEMRWWGRLLISMDNLTYFFWFWTAFFWIGFNYYSLFAERSYHFSATGMFTFMFIIQILSWGMIIASSMRYTLETSMEANEVISLSMDNIWRSTQLFYITAPLLLYSIIKGIQDFTRYHFYGEDISFWVGGDRGAMSTNLVKYWTLFLILCAVFAWIYWLVEGRFHQGKLSAVLIVTLIALDVLHPCTYLWVGQTKMTKEEANKMTWMQALRSRGWWERRIYALVLNQGVTGLFKWLGPVWFVAMPFLTLVMPYIGVNQAFMMLGSTTQR
eukprot:TRINITY_DN8165_c0_g5_i1.p1 TRINITY_DN8165_c0_g5~~TRINITY_DN8165_c0_g5_i1.p1  ORF type:complete len:1495 (-),score=312.76 TRINITY_DN8165_c0_g5_i1:139-4623(-)